MEQSMQLSNEQYREIWDWIYGNLGFRPHCHRGHDFFPWKPFKIPGKHVVYGIENMTEEQEDVMDALIDQVFINVTEEGQKIYSLDWQHQAFLHDPRHVMDGHRLWFVGYYPDGDYYFFIDEHRSFGYLSHPWRQEVWIFGDALIEEFQHIYHKLGWNLLYEFEPS